MSSPFLCGVVSAWAAAKVALAGFFILTYAYRRREAEYLLFGVLCFAMAVVSGGTALSYSVSNPDDWFPASRIAHFGAILSGAVNLHFTLAYTRREGAKTLVRLVYAVALVHAVLLFAGFWWVDGSVQVRTSDFGSVQIAHVVALPAGAALSFYAVVVLELWASAVLLVQGYRSGITEAAWAFGGGVVIALAGLNDVLVAMGSLGSIYLVPHAFLVYAFAVATTLPLRYQTKEKELEATASDLAQATEELRNSYVELQVVQTQLSDKQQLAQVGELAAAIAHEVRNPLAIIVNACASLKRPQLEDSDRGMLLGIVEEEAARLNRLVTDLLRFARPVRLNRSEVPLDELLERARARVGESHQLEVREEGDEPITTVWADPGLLPLVFENLVSNACQAMRDGGTVVVHVRREVQNERELARISVQDEGHGMDEDVMARATDPFFTTRPSGTGLGLPIVDRIVSAHGGKLEIESSPGEGTTVSMLVPLEASDDPDEDEKLPEHLKSLLESARRKAR